MNRDTNKGVQGKKAVHSDDCQQTVHREDSQDMNMDTDVYEDLSRSRTAAGSSLGTINQGSSTSFHEPSTRGARYRISTFQIETASNSKPGAQSEDKNRDSHSSSSGQLITSMIKWGNFSHGSSSSGSEKKIDFALEVRSVLTNVSTLFTRKLKKIPETFNYLIFSETRIHPRNSNVVSEHGVTELVAFVSSYRSKDNVQNSESQEVSQRHTIEQCRDSLIQDLVMDLWMLIEFSLLTLKEYENVIDFTKIHEYITCFEIMKEDRVLKQKRFHDLKAWAVSQRIFISRLSAIKELVNLIDDAVGKIHYSIFIIKIDEQLNDKVRQTTMAIRRLGDAVTNYKDW